MRAVCGGVGDGLHWGAGTLSAVMEVPSDALCPGCAGGFMGARIRQNQWACTLLFFRVLCPQQYRAQS